MKGTIVGTIIRLIRIFLRFDHFPGPQYGADRFRMGLFYGSNARIGQIPGGFYTARPSIRTHPSFSPIVMPLLVFSTRKGLSVTVRRRFSGAESVSDLCFSLIFPQEKMTKSGFRASFYGKRLHKWRSAFKREIHADF